MLAAGAVHASVRVSWALFGLASLGGGFMESFITLNIINFVDVAKRENDGVSCDVRRVLLP
jgi:hypothetical protein